MIGWPRLIKDECLSKRSHVAETRCCRCFCRFIAYPFPCGSTSTLITLVGRTHKEQVISQCVGSTCCTSLRAFTLSIYAQALAGTGNSCRGAVYEPAAVQEHAGVALFVFRNQQTVQGCPAFHTLHCYVLGSLKKLIIIV